MKLDSLSLVIDSKAAQADLAKLSQSLDKAGASIQKMDQTFARSAIAIDASINKSILAFQKYAQVVALLDKIKIAANPAQGILAIGNALASVKGPSPATLRNIQAFMASLATVKPMPGAAQFAKELDMIAAAAGRAGAALRTLPRQMQTYGSAHNAAEKTVRSHTASVNTLGLSLGNLSGRFNLAYQAGTLFSTVFSVFTIGEWVRSVYDAGVQMLKLQKAMLFTTASFQQASDATEEYIAIEQRLGLSIKDNVEYYGRFVIAAKASSLSLAQANKIYSDVETALTVVGASSQQASLALYGMTEMMQKGVVYSKEFNRQIGAQLPGNAYLGAQALKQLTGQAVSVVEFFQRMHAGTLMSAQFIPIWAEKVNEMYEPLLSLAQARPDVAVNRLKNAFFDFNREVGSSNFMQELGKSINGITDKIVKLNENGLYELTPAAKRLADMLGSNLADAVRTGANAIQFLMDHLDAILAGVKLFVNYEIAKVFYNWGTSALTASKDIWAFVFAQKAANAAIAESDVIPMFSKKAGQGASFGKASTMAKYTRGAGPAMEAAAIAQLMSGGGTSKAENLGKGSGRFVLAAEESVGGTGFLAGLGNAAVSLAMFTARVGIAGAVLFGLYEALKDVRTGIMTDQGNEVTVGDIVKGYSQPFMDAMTSLAKWAKDFVSANDPKNKSTVTSPLSPGSSVNTVLNAVGDIFGVPGAGTLLSAYGQVGMNNAKHIANTRAGGPPKLTAAQLMAERQKEIAISEENNARLLDTLGPVMEEDSYKAPTLESVRDRFQHYQQGDWRYGAPMALRNGIPKQDIALQQAMAKGANGVIDPDLLWGIHMQEGFGKAQGASARGNYGITDSAYAQMLKLGATPFNRNNPDQALEANAEARYLAWGQKNYNGGQAFTRGSAYLFNRLGPGDYPKLMAAASSSDENYRHIDSDQILSKNPFAFMKDKKGHDVPINPDFFSKVAGKYKVLDAQTLYSNLLAKGYGVAAGDPDVEDNEGAGGTTGHTNPLRNVKISSEARKTFLNYFAETNPGVSAQMKAEIQAETLNQQLTNMAQIGAAAKPFSGGWMKDQTNNDLFDNRLRREHQTISDAENPLSKEIRLQEEAIRVSALRAKGLDTEADAAQRAYKLGEEGYSTLVGETLEVNASAKAWTDAAAVKERMLDITERLNKAISESRVTLETQDFARDNGGDPKGQFFHDYVMKNLANGRTFAQTTKDMSADQAASAHSDSDALFGSNLQTAGRKLTDRVEDSRAMRGLSPGQRQINDTYKQALIATTGSRSDATWSDLEKAAKTIPGATKLALDYTKEMTVNITNGFQRWADSVKTIGEDLQDIKGQFMEGLSNGLTDLFTGKKWDPRLMMKGIFRNMVQGGVDNMLKGALGAFGLADIAGVKADGSQAAPFWVRMWDGFAGVAGTASGTAGLLGSVFGTATGAITDGATGSAIGSVLGSQQDGSIFKPFYVIQVSSALDALGGGGSGGGLLSSIGNLLGGGGGGASALNPVLFNGAGGSLLSAGTIDTTLPSLGGGGFLSSIGTFFSSLFADGGYTGTGGRNQPAGVVHKGEYVFNQAAVNRIGVENLNRLHKGYADGGYVGNSSYATGIGGQGAPVINIIDQRSGGAPVTARQSQKDGQTTIDILVRDSVNRQIAGGGFDPVMQTTYGNTRVGTPR